MQSFEFIAVKFFVVWRQRRGVPSHTCRRVAVSFAVVDEGLYERAILWVLAVRRTERHIWRYAIRNEQIVLLRNFCFDLVIA